MSAPPAPESWSLTDSLWGAVAGEAPAPAAPAADLRRTSGCANGALKPATTARHRRHSTGTAPGGSLSPESAALMSCWTDVGEKGGGAAARRVTPEKRPANAGKKKHHGAARPRAASFEGPTRPDSSARRAWRAAQWTDFYKESAVVQWIPAADADEHDRFVAAVSDYFDRFGSRQFHQIVDKTGKGPLWHAVDAGDVAGVEHLLSVGCAKGHDPTRDPASSPWLLAHRYGDARLFEMLDVYLDPALSDEVLDGLLATESRRLARSQRRSEAAARSTCGWVYALFPCGDGGAPCLDAGDGDAAALDGASHF